jgi:ClpP class serine protease
MTSVTDIAGFLKTKLNIDIFDIYASKSTRKNEMSRLMKDISLSFEERTKLAVQELDFVNEFFHAAIRENLGIKSDSEVFTGAAYHAQEAISLGLAHEINTLDYALSTAHQLGLKSKITQLFTNLKH